MLKQEEFIRKKNSHPFSKLLQVVVFYCFKTYFTLFSFIANIPGVSYVAYLDGVIRDGENGLT